MQHFLTGYVARYVAELHSLDLYQATMVLGRAVAQMHSVALVAPLAALLERRLVFTSCALVTTPLLDGSCDAAPALDAVSLWLGASLICRAPSLLLEKYHVSK